MSAPELHNVQKKRLLCEFVQDDDWEMRVGRGEHASLLVKSVTLNEQPFMKKT